MLRGLYLVLAVPLAVALVAHAQSDDDPGFVPIFDGKDLAGWQVVGPNDWHAENGILWTEGKGGWLRSDRPYADFVWKLEYRITRAANSGILLRSAAEGNPTFTGLEIQILDDAGSEPNLNSTGSILGASAPPLNYSKPLGDWNYVEISFIGRRLVVYLNGNRVQKVNLDDPAFQNARERPLGRVRNVGYIGLESHTSRVDFRNLRINVLKPAA
jgi:hypothetical protein